MASLTKITKLKRANKKAAQGKKTKKAMQKPGKYKLLPLKG